MRLLTRSDFDGICCAVLLKELGLMDEMVYAHPKDLQDGKIAVGRNDILANVPYVPGCGLWFDHHSSEQERLQLAGQYEGRSEAAPSAARVIYDFYGREKLGRFAEMLKFVDRVDSAQLTEDEILDPKGWVLLGFICDPRTGLGYHKDFRISNLTFMGELVEHIRTKTIDEILALPDTQAPSNRFLVYSLFPKTNISIRVIDGKAKEFVAISVGYSILNRTATVNVGSLMLKYGGGGHRAVGTCQLPYAMTNTTLKEIVSICKASAA